VVIGRLVNEATSFDKECLNRSMKMNVPAMGPYTDFQAVEKELSHFLSLKFAYLIPHLASRESGGWLDEATQTYAYALLLHAAREDKRTDQADKCIVVARHDCATVAWNILCKRMDGRSFARSLSLLDNLMLRQRPGRTLIVYVHFMRHIFDGYNETCEMIDASCAIHPHHLGLFMQRGILSTRPFGHAKQCVINAFDTNCLLSADEVMASILFVTPHMDEELPDSYLTAPVGPASLISSFVAVGRGSQSGRGHNNRGRRGGRGMPDKWSACGS
jgi:hypothetical protein